VGDLGLPTFEIRNKGHFTGLRTQAKKKGESMRGDGDLGTFGRTRFAAVHFAGQRLAASTFSRRYVWPQIHFAAQIRKTKTLLAVVRLAASTFGRGTFGRTLFF
jgi:hypothetical protein